MFLRPIRDAQIQFIPKIATDKAKNMKIQCCTLSVFYVTRRETIIAKNFKVFSFRVVHVIHVVSPDNTSSRR